MPMEDNRIWHDPVVEVYGNAITPGIRCSAAAYDLANRRWYKLNVEDQPNAHTNPPTLATFDPESVPSDEWLSSTVSRHIKEYYTNHRKPPPWNTISTTSSGSPVTFEELEEHVARRAIMYRFNYGFRTEDRIPTIPFHEIEEKRIEFDGDVEGHQREICSREAIFRWLESNGSKGQPIDELNGEMEQKCNIVPILAVVLHDETSQWILSRPTTVEDDLEDYFHVTTVTDRNIEHEDHGDPDEWDNEQFQDPEDMQPSEPEPDGHEIAGFLMPYAGPSLDVVSPSIDGNEDMPTTSTRVPSRNQKVDAPIQEHQLRELACGVRNLAEIGIEHGDICYWNIVLTPVVKGSRLNLIDMGDTAPGYEGDGDALGKFFLWSLLNSKYFDSKAKKRVILAAVLLRVGDFGSAIELLGGQGNKRKRKRESEKKAE